MVEEPKSRGTILDPSAQYGQLHRNSSPCPSDSQPPSHWSVHLQANGGGVRKALTMCNRCGTESDPSKQQDFEIPNIPKDYLETHQVRPQNVGSRQKTA